MKTKKLIKTIVDDLKGIDLIDKNRPPEEDKLEYVENMDFDSRENAVFDLGMKVAYENVLERMAVSYEEYNGGKKKALTIKIEEWVKNFEYDHKIANSNEPLGVSETGTAYKLLIKTLEELKN